MTTRRSICEKLLVVWLLVLSPIQVLGAGDQRGLVVHEWGTFTALQDEQGKALGGINVDDEALPPFVHQLSRHLTEPNHSYIYMKGLPQRHPLVTLRLETPVMYFYLPDSAPRPLNLDVRVRFRGGWLSEFFPQAEANAPGLGKIPAMIGPLNSKTVSTLAWNNLKVGTPGAVPQTDSHVWLAPRQVDSLCVTAESGESEKYLFYRGVGNFDAPLRASYGEGQLQLRGNVAAAVGQGQSLPVGPFWLVHVLDGRRCAFRTFSTVTATANESKILTTAPLNFAATDFDPANLGRLRQEMQQALVHSGLREDEARAMLATWQRAYFQSPGLRLFFVVPRAWTDHYLRLEISQPAQIERVMMARIELISPEQRRLLDELQAAPASSNDWVRPLYKSKSPAARKFLEGRSDFGDLGVEIPQNYQLYLKLGRFRNALVLAEARRNPTKPLARFINTYGLHQYRE